MNLQLADKNLKKCYEDIRKRVPRQVEFLMNRLLEFTLLYHHGDFEVLVPLNNVFVLCDFLKKYLNRVHTENGLELFTEEIGFDAIENLQSKGATLKSLENKQERQKMIEKAKLSEDEAETLNQYYEGIPNFSIEEVKAFVQDHDTIEEGDVVTISVSIKLSNFENQQVIDNIQRNSFNYPGQEDRITKDPYLYMMLMEKGQKMVSYQKFSFKVFCDSTDAKKIKEEVTVTARTVFKNHGAKKLTVKLFNDTYIGCDNNLETEVTGK